MKTGNVQLTHKKPEKRSWGSENTVAKVSYFECAIWILSCLLFMLCVLYHVFFSSLPSKSCGYLFL